MVFSTCCLALSGGALAVDELTYYEFAEVNSVSLLSMDDGVSLFSLKDSGSFSVELVSGSVKYGISGTDYTTWSSGYDSSYSSADGSTIRLGNFKVSPATNGGYMAVDGGTLIRIEWPVSASYPDEDSLDYWGTMNGQLFVWADGAGQVGAVSPYRCYLLVNGERVGNYSQFDDFTYSVKNGIGESVTSVGIEYYYSQSYFDLLATDVQVPFVGFYFAPGAIQTNANTSQQGFFSGLFRWLANIRDNVSSGFSSAVSAVTSLPSKIADAIKGLFVPNDAQMEELKASFNTLLSEKLGFVYQSVSLVDGVFDAVFDAVDNPGSDVSFTVPAFPSFDVDGTEVSLWDKPVNVDISSNEVVQTVQQVASPFVVAVMAWGFIHSMEDAFLAFVGGQSLADWVRNRKEDTD